MCLKIFLSGMQDPESLCRSNSSIARRAIVCKCRRGYPDSLCTDGKGLKHGDSARIHDGCYSVIAPEMIILRKVLKIQLLGVFGRNNDLDYHSRGLFVNAIL